MGGMDRRVFLKTVGVTAGAALASRLELLHGATTVVKHTPPATGVSGTPLIQAFILGAKDERQLDALRNAAQRQGVQFFLKTEPLADAPSVAACAEQIRSNPPDGVLLITSARTLPEHFRNITQHFGAVPTIVCDAWMEPALAIRLLATVWRMKNSRLCLVREKEQEFTVPVVGATVREIPQKRFEEWWLKLETSREMRALALSYSRAAGPERDGLRMIDFLAASRRYFVMRRLLEAEKCHGIAVTAPAGLAVSCLLDEGVAADCGGDVDALVSQQLALLLLQRPGETGEASPTKLLGPMNPYRAEFVVRPGVGIVTVWPKEQAVTWMKLKDGTTMSLGEGDGRRLRVLGRHDAELRAFCRLAGIAVAA